MVSCVEAVASGDLGVESDRTEPVSRWIESEARIEPHRIAQLPVQVVVQVLRRGADVADGIRRGVTDVDVPAVGW
jgi:hypothetical protein